MFVRATFLASNSSLQQMFIFCCLFMPCWLWLRSTQSLRQKVPLILLVSLIVLQNREKILNEEEKKIKGNSHRHDL